MKFNWKTLIALIVLVGTFIWGVESLRTRSYSGTDVTVSVNSGSVTITNPSIVSIPVQLIGTGTRTFSITDSSNGLSGTSVRQGSGNNSTQLLEFDLPAGVSKFSIARAKDVTFIATGVEPLEISVQPLNAEDTKSTLIAVMVVMLGAISYIAYSTRDFWIRRLPGNDFNIRDTQPTKVIDSSGQGASDLHPFGDNRASTKV